MQASGWSRTTARPGMPSHGATRAPLRALPARRTVEYEELPARVSKYAVLTVRGAQYSASSQLVGQRLTVRLYTDPIECWLGGARVLERARLRDGQRHPRDIDTQSILFEWQGAPRRGAALRPDFLRRLNASASSGWPLGSTQPAASFGRAHRMLTRRRWLPRPRPPRQVPDPTPPRSGKGRLNFLSSHAGHRVDADRLIETYSHRDAADACR